MQEIYRLADKYSNVYIITSCRTTDSSAFMKINTKYRIKTYEIPDLAKDEIDKAAKSYPIILSLQQNKKYADLLCVPFYLNLIVSGGFVEENINDENNFRNLIWERIICLKDKCKNMVSYKVMLEKLLSVLFLNVLVVLLLVLIVIL